MKRYAIFSVCCLVLIFSAETIFAQQGGFTDPVVPRNDTRATVVHRQYQNATVNQLASLPNKSFVVVSGNLVDFDGRKNYTFRDSTGEITIEINPYFFWDLSIGHNDRVTILVEVERKRNGRIEVEAKGIRKA